MTELPASIIKEIQGAMSAEAARKLFSVATITGDGFAIVIDKAAEAARASLAGRKGQQP